MKQADRRKTADPLLTSPPIRLAPCLHSAPAKAHPLASFFLLSRSRQYTLRPAQQPLKTMLSSKQSSFSHAHATAQRTKPPTCVASSYQHVFFQLQPATSTPHCSLPQLVTFLLHPRAKQRPSEIAPCSQPLPRAQQRLLLQDNSSHQSQPGHLTAKKCQP